MDNSEEDENFGVTEQIEYTDETRNLLSNRFLLTLNL